MKPTLLANNDTTFPADPADCADPAPRSSTSPSLQRKKSVTFSPETKAEDGESVKQYYKKWVSSQQSSDPGFDANTLNPALKSIEPAAAKVTSPSNLPQPSEILHRQQAESQPPQRKRRRSSSSSKRRPALGLIPHYSLQSPSSSTNGTGSTYVHPALAYLTAHHTSRGTWKFNKADQNYLLKHIFHHTHVPSQYDPALASYLKGLASENTKARIRREALEIRAEDEKWLATPDTVEQSNDGKEQGSNSNSNSNKEMGVERETLEQSLARRLQDYNAAVDRMRSILEAKEDAREAAEWDLGPAHKEWEARLERRRRAEVVLWGVGETGQKVMEALQMATKNRQDQQQQQKEEEPARSTSTTTDTTTGGLAEQPGYRTQMGPKRIRFDEGDNNEVNGVNDWPRTDAPMDAPSSSSNKNNTTTTTTIDSTMSNNSAKEPTPKSKRQRKRHRSSKSRQGAIPDDLTTSDSDSDNDPASEDEETKLMMQRKRDLQERLAAQKRELDRARREVEEELLVMMMMMMMMMMMRLIVKLVVGVGVGVVMGMRVVVVIRGVQSRIQSRSRSRNRHRRKKVSRVTTGVMRVRVKVRAGVSEKMKVRNKGDVESECENRYDGESG